MTQTPPIIVTSIGDVTPAEDGSHVLLNLATEGGPLTLAIPFGQLVNGIKRLTYAHGACLKILPAR